ncbi:MAG: IPT/TIG domain-containing protein [Bryobacteraceae bacterium]|nr:IPT/TIG domain-containing protein [Bryobacteraceae bacterium]MDW8377578.1 IPT/TIG domain-containing protein [Bryobacterales bacterium]
MKVNWNALQGGEESRRRFFERIGLGLFYTAAGAFAQQLTLTPEQTLGPYYPDRMPLDRDNDLIILNDNITPAVGTVTWLSGKVLGRNGKPMRGALVEIWQADNNGAYIHSQSPIANRDANFQGYGRFVTGSSGEYLFRTVKPGLYPGRTRHIHYQITTPAGERLVTQCYIEGEPLNNSDGILNGIRDAAQRASVIVPFTPIPDSRIGELAARFDIVMGFTPADPPADRPYILPENGVVNGAGFQSGVTPGAWISIFGDNFATTSRVWNTSDIVQGKLPTELEGVRVTINGKPAAIYYVSPSQLNVQAPDDTAQGPVQVVVTNSFGASNPVTVQLQPVLPGFFLFDRFYVSAARPDGSLVAPSGLFPGQLTRPASPGELIVLYGTGFGPTIPTVPAGEVFQGSAQTANNVQVRMGGLSAEVRFAGLVSAGLYQLNVIVPNLADGDHDVVATVAGVRTQPLARLRVQRG